eukprot:gene10611-11736_t
MKPKQDDFHWLARKMLWKQEDKLCMGAESYLRAIEFRYKQAGEQHETSSMIEVVDPWMEKNKEEATLDYIFGVLKEDMDGVENLRYSVVAVARLFGIGDALVVVVDDLFGVVHATVTNFDGVPIEDFPKWVVYRKVFIYRGEEFVADVGADIFAAKAFLAKKPKAWRQSLLLEVLYGGWSLVRDEIVSVFGNCKEVEYVTLINLLDTHCPLVLSLYSIEFKNNYSLLTDL